MRAKQFERVIASFTTWSESDVDQRVRRLREARLLPVGGRGLNAPSLTPRDGALILISIAAAENAVDAGRLVELYANLIPPPKGQAFAGAPTLVDAVAAILSRPDKAVVSSFSVARTWPFAAIFCQYEKFYYGFPTDESAVRAGHHISLAMVYVNFKGSLLQQLAMALADQIQTEAQFIADSPESDDLDIAPRRREPSV